MKKPLLALILFSSLLSLNSFSQSFATYKSSYFGNEHNIQVMKANDDYELDIFCESLDRTYDVGGILFTKKTHDAFLKNLELAKAKFIEWKKTAEENKVTSLEKEMNFRTDAIGFFKTLSGWKSTKTISLRFVFKIYDSEGIHCKLSIKTGRITASDNEYMDMQGFDLVFTSAEEIDQFMSLIPVEKVENFINQSNNKEKLFKD